MSSFLKLNPSALVEDSGLFQQSLASFVACNEDPASSPNFKSKVPDLPGPLLQLLRSSTTTGDARLVLLLLKVRRQISLGHVVKQAADCLFQLIMCV